MKEEEIKELRKETMEKIKEKIAQIKTEKKQNYKNGYIILLDNGIISAGEDGDISGLEIFILNKTEYLIYFYLKNERELITTGKILEHELGLTTEEIEKGLNFLEERKVIRSIDGVGNKYYILSLRNDDLRRYEVLLEEQDSKNLERECLSKLLNAKQNKIISLEEIKKLKEDINELESKTYGNILVFLGIFISIFSLISININFLDILKDLNMYEKISLISVVNLVTVISIYALIGLIEIVKRPKTKDSKFPTGVVVIIIILSLIFIISTGLASKENKVDAEKTESQKNIYTIEVTGKIDKETINILEKLNGTNNIKIVPKENKVVAEKTESQKNIYTIEVTGKIDKETINILEKLNGTNNIKIVPKEN
jgi:hypothetical protein